MLSDKVMITNVEFMRIVGKEYIARLGLADAQVGTIYGIRVEKVKDDIVVLGLVKLKEAV